MDIPTNTCDNCEYEGEACLPLGDVDNLVARLEAGSEVPNGVCPECGAFTYRRTEAERVVEIVERIKDDPPPGAENALWSLICGRIIRAAHKETDYTLAQALDKVEYLIETLQALYGSLKWPESHQ